MGPAKDSDLPGEAAAAEAEDFDESSDLCDFGYVLVRQPIPAPIANVPDAAG